MFIRKHYRTVVLSDIHLGTTHSKVEEVSRFLRCINCDRLILNGDIIDGWHIRKNGTRRWQPAHTQFFKILMKMMENYGTEIIYVRGNHDDFLQRIAPFSFGNIQIVKDYIHTAPDGKRYYVLHGDTLDYNAADHHKMGYDQYNDSPEYWFYRRAGETVEIIGDIFRIAPQLSCRRSKDILQTPA